MTKEDTKPTTMGKKKVIAINGSPRRNWNTAKLCQAALDGAAAAGAETELIHLESMKFKGCMSCFACDTCQFSNYEPYAANLFDPVHKKERLEKQFPLELENCFELGKRLVEKALEV
jgi:ferredoxin